ncbi:hypothetical protein, partial [Rhizobium herbae]
CANRAGTGRSGWKVTYMNSLNLADVMAMTAGKRDAKKRFLSMEQIFSRRIMQPDELLKVF